MRVPVRLLFLALVLSTAQAGAERIKDLASVQGARYNQLVGYGIVVGLDNSGDQTTQTPFTVQSVINMLAQLGVNLPVDKLTSVQLKNVAAVMVTASLPPFATPGQAIDIVVGIGSIAKASTVGKIGGLALVYFLVMSTFALGIGLALVVLLVLLPWFIAPVSYLVITGVAIAAGTDLSSETVNVPALAIGLAAVVAVATLGVLLLAGLLGRPLSPKR